MFKRRGVFLSSAVAVCLVAMLFFSGCSKVSHENYSKLSLGMDYGQVIEILGNPDDCQSKMGTKNCMWGTESKNISLKFLADKLAYRSSKGL